MNTCLDKCLVNCPNQLFEKCFAINMLIKNDHKGIILPAGIKLPPIRENRKMHSYLALARQNWTEVQESTELIMQ